MDANEEINDNEQTKSNKKKSKNKILIWIIALVLLTVTCLAVYFIFFNRNIKGSWGMVNNQNVKQILTFKDGNSLTCSQGSLILETNYTLDGNKVKFDLSQDDNSENIVEYTYDIAGFINKRLFLTDSNGKVEEYDQCEPFKIDPPTDFNLVEPLLGTWKNEEFNICYDFKKDGTAFLIKGKIRIAFIYNVDDTKITVIVNNGQSEDTVRKTEVNYKINEGNKLIISGIEYIKQ